MFQAIVKKVVCKKKYRNMNVGQVTTFIERSKSFLTYQNDVQYIPCFIYYEEFEEHFCTVKEYRKLKLEKINERRG